MDVPLCPCVDLEHNISWKLFFFVRSFNPNSLGSLCSIEWDGNDAKKGATLPEEKKSEYKCKRRRFDFAKLKVKLIFFYRFWFRQCHYVEQPDFSEYLKTPANQSRNESQNDAHHLITWGKRWLYLQFQFQFAMSVNVNVCGKIDDLFDGALPGNWWCSIGCWQIGSEVRAGSRSYFQILWEEHSSFDTVLQKK